MYAYIWGYLPFWDWKNNMLFQSLFCVIIPRWGGRIESENGGWVILQPALPSCNCSGTHIDPSRFSEHGHFMGPALAALALCHSQDVWICSTELRVIQSLKRLSTWSCVLLEVSYLVLLVRIQRCISISVHFLGVLLRKFSCKLLETCATGCAFCCSEKKSQCRGSYAKEGSINLDQNPPKNLGGLGKEWYFPNSFGYCLVLFGIPIDINVIGCDWYMFSLHLFILFAIDLSPRASGIPRFVFCFWCLNGKTSSFHYEYWIYWPIWWWSVSTSSILECGSYCAPFVQRIGWHAM